MVTLMISVVAVALVLWLTTKTSGRTVRLPAAPKPAKGVKIVHQRWLPELPKVPTTLPSLKITFPVRRQRPAGVTILKGGWKW